MYVYMYVYVDTQGIPLSHEPSLDLHQCIMAYHSSKQRPFVFGLTLPGGNECLIQVRFGVTNRTQYSYVGMSFAYICVRFFFFLS